jgi:predicted PurR-regulated permease PerM
VGVLLLAVPVLAQQIGTVATSAPAQLERLRHALRGSSSRALRDAAAHVPNLPAAGLLDAPWGVLRTEDLLARVRAAGHAVTAVAATMLLAFFWTVEGERRVRALALLAPLDRRREIHAFAREAERKVGAYVRGQAVVCLVIGAMAWAAYARLGLPCAFILGLAYAAGEAVPVLGPLVGTMLAVAVALSVDPSLALWVVAVAAGLQLTENYLLVPRVMKRAVGVNPLVTLLAVSGFGSVFGVAGAVLAIPMAAVAQLSIDRMLGLGRAPGRGAGADGQPPPGRDRASLLRYQVREIGADVRKLLRLPDGEAPARVRGRLHAERLEDAVESLAADLDRILARQQRGPSP